LVIGIASTGTPQSRAVRVVISPAWLDHQLHVQRRTGLGDPSKDFRAAVLQRSQGNGMASRSSGSRPHGIARRPT
jgi:hypothetical protein